MHGRAWLHPAQRKNSRGHPRCLYLQQSRWPKHNWSHIGWYDQLASRQWPAGEPLITRSDHLPVSMNLLILRAESLRDARDHMPQPPRLKWKNELADYYHECILWPPLIKIDTLEASVENFSCRLSVAICTAASSSQMTVTRRHKTNCSSIKLWFDNSWISLKHTLKPSLYLSLC